MSKKVKTISLEPINLFIALQKICNIKFKLILVISIILIEQTYYKNLW